MKKKNQPVKGPYRPPLGNDVYNWPEFKALLKRLGVLWHLPTTSIIIEVPEDKLVKVIQTFHGSDMDNPNGFVTDHPCAPDTTTFHNKKFRTRRPLNKKEK